MSRFSNRRLIGYAVQCTVNVLRKKPPQSKQRNMSIAIDIDDDILKPFRRIGYNFIRCGVAEREVSDLSKLTRDQKRKIPKGYLNFFANDASGQTHLRWMLQKDSLQQDVMLTSSGGLGAVLCRRMAMAYAELVQRPVEVVIMSPDTTMEDIFQQRTLRTQNIHSPAELNCTDMAGVRAARQGHILILDGLHRVEKNALSSLKSLLARREVLLRDGRVLISSDDHLTLKEGNFIGSCTNVFPISEDFRILALCSKSEGRLDPSVRSHFQIQRVEAPPCDILYENLLINHSHDTLVNTPNPSVENAATHEFPIPHSTKSIVIPDTSDEKSARELSTLVTVMNDTTVNKNRSFCFSLDAMHAIHRIRIHFPQTPLSDLLARAYPYACVEARLRALMDGWPMAVASRTLLRQACLDLGMTLEPTSTSITVNNVDPYALIRVEPIADDPRNVLVHFSRQKLYKKQGIFAAMFNDFSLGDVVVKVRSGGFSSAYTQHSVTNFVATKGSKEVLVAMLQEHFAGRDVLLVGPQGEGKRTIAKHFCSLLGYDAHVFAIHKDMKGTDLLWKNLSCNSAGWAETPLLTAARLGQICILDGIEKLSPDKFSVLQGMITNRELVLPDGTKYSHCVSIERFDEDVRKVHPAFRVIALASIESFSTLNISSPPIWMSEEVMSMFATIPLPAPSRELDV
jgi:AAA domain (dynein-related subfamily)